MGDSALGDGRMIRRGFGIAAAVPQELIAPLAKAAEESGYSTFWVNDTPGADGIQALRRAGEETSSIRLGVGVIPLDRRTPDEIAARIVELELPVDRLMIGLGSGGAHSGSLDLVERGIVEVRDLTGCSVAVGALGMKMIELAARLADGVILNWLTPDWASRSAALAKGSQVGHRPEVIGYVRTALTESRPKLKAEGERYASFPSYARHFARMGVDAIDTCVMGSAEEIGAGLRSFDAELDETVVRAIVAKDSLESYMAVLNAGRPQPA
jgi:alkanesulfonate monooxygenase SsuD/methylene tetrahydromethanopterin reductase-like flavin-dependent oxidoreductase (luciferase family)